MKLSLFKNVLLFSVLLCFGVFPSIIVFSLFFKKNLEGLI